MPPANNFTTKYFGDEDLEVLMGRATSQNIHDAESATEAKLSAARTSVGKINEKLKHAIKSGSKQQQQQNAGSNNNPAAPLEPAPQVERQRSLSEVPVVCHGRVASIEKMVPTQWWKVMFDAVYLKTDGDVVEDPVVTKEEIGMLESDPAIKAIFDKGFAGSTEGSKILDLCCGQGRHTLHLAKAYPHLELFGHDQSSYLIQLAQERATKLPRSCAQPIFTVGDCRRIPYPSATFDLVIVMGNSFGYFSSEDDDLLVLSEIKRVLVPGGMAVLDLADGDHVRTKVVERSWEWIDDTSFVCRERELSKDGRRLSSREVISNTSKGVVRDQFYQERLYSGSDIAELIAKAGLEVCVAEGVESATQAMTAVDQLSKRQEDLGMMGHRMMISMQKPGNNNRKSTTVAADKQANSLAISLPMAPPKSSLFENLIVVMGDPSQNCFGKLNNTWNPEDIATRQKLYDALKAIGYTSSSMSVLESHKNLYQDLETFKRKNPKAVVFNLCDEGFDNDALKELHVPALLEVLRIPYTGAGPNCLAHCYDKGLVNRTSAALGVPTPKETFFLTDIAMATTPAKSPEEADALALKALMLAVEQQVGYPAFIKPMRGDNSLGITPRSIVNTPNELTKYVLELRTLGLKDIIAQEYLTGTEYGVGVVGNLSSNSKDGGMDGLHFFPILEVDFSNITKQGLPPILGYESKWDPSSPYWSDIGYKRAALSPQVEDRLKRACVVLWERFGCRDYARFDWRCDRGKGTGYDNENGTIKLLEVNPNPGWCWDGKLAYMGKLEGKDYKDVLSMILDAAKKRIDPDN